MKYGKEVVLTATEDNNFRTTKLSVNECSSPEEADKELRKWIDKLPELKKINGNQQIIENSLTK